jgi:hypothetical protein
MELVRPGGERYGQRFAEEGSMQVILRVEFIAGLLFLVVVGLSKMEHELIHRPQRSLLVDPEREQVSTTTSCSMWSTRTVWRKALGGRDRERAFAAAKVATLLDPRRALRNGTVWIEHRHCAP